MRRASVHYIVAIIMFLGAVLAFGQEATPSEEAALQAYRQGAFAKAVQLYTTALSETSDPSHRAQLHIRIAWTLFALGQEDAVGTHLRAALLENADLTLVPDYYTQEFLDRFEQARRASMTGVLAATPTAAELEAAIASVNQRLASGENLQDALLEVEKLALAYPSDGRLVPLRIQLLDLLGRTAEAEELRQVHLIGAEGGAGLVAPLSVPELILRANRLLDEGDVMTSLDLLRDAVSRQPSNVAALELMAEAARRGGRWQEAEFALKSALGLQPDNIGLKLRLGEIHLSSGDASAARDVFGQITERNPHSDRAWAALGLLDARLGKHDVAIEELQRALTENPLLPEVQLAFGELLLLQGTTDKALEALHAAANLMHEDAQLQARLGQAALAKGRTEEALGHLRAAVGAGFSPPDVQRALALALLLEGRFAEAERALASIPAGSSTEATEAAMLQSMLQLRREEFAAAESTLLAKVIEGPRGNDPVALSLLGAALYHQRRYDEAVSVLSRARDLAPEDSVAMANLVRAEEAAAAVELRESARSSLVLPSGR